MPGLGTLCAARGAQGSENVPSIERGARPWTRRHVPQDVMRREGRGLPGAARRGSGPPDAEGAPPGTPVAFPRGFMAGRRRGARCPRSPPPSGSRPGRARRAGDSPGTDRVRPVLPQRHPDMHAGGLRNGARQGRRATWPPPGRREHCPAGRVGRRAAVLDTGGFDGDRTAKPECRARGVRRTAKALTGRETAGTGPPMRRTSRTDRAGYAAFGR